MKEKNEVSREAHKKALLALLLRGEVVTQHIHGKILGCARTAARIFDLREQGHKIITNMVYNDASGEKYAEYSYEGVAPVRRREKSLKGKSVAYFSKAILNQPKPSLQNIERLF